MTTYAERIARRQAWLKANPVTPGKRHERPAIDCPSGYAARPAGAEGSNMVFALAVLTLPLWLMPFGIYLIYEEWDRRRRPRGTCLAYHPIMKGFKPD